MAIATPFAGTFAADPHHSSVVFGVQHIEVSIFRASFGDLEARLIATDEDLRLEGAVAVQSVSITEPPEFREHVVRGPDFLDADNHPEIRFVSEHIDLLADGRVTVTGELTIKGVSRTVIASGSYRPPVEDPFGAQRAALKLRAVIDRRHWGLVWQLPLPSGGDALGWTVDVTVHLELVQQP